MKPTVRTVAAASIAMFVSLNANADDCRFTRQIEQSIAAADTDTVFIVAKAGRLEVRGGSDSQVRVTGTACASSEELLAAISVDLSTDGQGIRAAADLPEVKSNWGNRYVYLHLEVEVPTKAALDIKDSSGNMLVEHVGSAHVQDSSGNMEIVDVGGDLSVRDSSGSVDIRDVRGDVTVTDSSGDIEIQTVAGVALIENDSSGNIDIRNVNADVVVRNDSSGDINIEKVGGLVQIDRDSSGAIKVNDVQGNVTVGYDSDGNISAKHVRGDFVVERDSGGRIDYSDVQGNVSTPGSN